MPRVYSAQRGQMPVLQSADPGEHRAEEAVPAVWRAGLQNDSFGGCATRTEKGSEGNGVRGVWETSVVRRRLGGGHLGSGLRTRLTVRISSGESSGFRAGRACYSAGRI